MGISELPVLALIGLGVTVSLYAGKLARRAGLPSLIGYLVTGVLMGASVSGVVSLHALESTRFVTNIALGFVAFSIGTELSALSLRQLGSSIVLIILFESFMAFLVVFGAVFAVTGGDTAVAMVFAALAPASAPAGTVAVIQEYRARGKLTKALYAVVGFDDGLAILIYGFAAAFARSLVSTQVQGFWESMLLPAREILLSVGLGALMGMLYTVLSRRLRTSTEIPALTFAFIAMTAGVAVHFHLSLILACMGIGFVLTNSTPRPTVNRIVMQNRNLMPLVFILFFFLAGAHLDVAALPALGLLGVVYIIARSSGKITGAWLGGRIGGAEPRIRKYLGMGILSQAGVAIGLSLILAQDFARIGTPQADRIASMVVTTIAATCVVFEVVGPLLAKRALRLAGELGRGAEDD